VEGGIDGEVTTFTLTPLYPMNIGMFAIELPYKECPVTVASSDPGLVGGRGFAESVGYSPAEPVETTFLKILGLGESGRKLFDPPKVSVGAKIMSGVYLLAAVLFILLLLVGLVLGLKAVRCAIKGGHVEGERPQTM
jgi:hypothetical protein